MSKAIQAWTIKLQDYPGWKEWKRASIGLTLSVDDEFSTLDEKAKNDFQFSEQIEKERQVIVQYLGLQETIDTLKECEYYFRRYPFRGLPVTRTNHLKNVCEMFFGRFYEFKTRLKNYFEAVKAVVPNHKINVGQLIKLFGREFAPELRARNIVHHHHRFEDTAIDRVFLTDLLSGIPAGEVWEREHQAAYRKQAKEWAQRVQRRGAMMDEFLEVTASATLIECKFLSKLISNP